MTLPIAVFILIVVLSLGVGTGLAFAVSYSRTHELARRLMDMLDEVVHEKEDLKAARKEFRDG